MKTQFFKNVPLDNQWLTPPKMSDFGVFTQSGAAVDWQLEMLAPGR